MRHVDVLVVGGGFGGVGTVRRLERILGPRAARVLLIAPENFWTFTPLLPEAASGTLEPRHAVASIRPLLRRATMMTGHVSALDVAARQAMLTDLNEERHEVGFEALVLAPGSVPATLPIPGLAEHAVGFKTLPDAIWLRNRVLRQLEAAHATDDHQRRRDLLTFTFVGGGYAGVEALAELESMARDALRSYPGLGAHDLRWVLVEAADRLLPGLADRLAEYSAAELRRRGVEIRLGTTMDSCEGGLVRLSDPRVAPFRSETIVFTAGQRPSPLGAEAALPTDGQGRIVVDDHLAVEGIDGVFALGDAAAVPDPDGGLSPPTAQHAVRQARACAANVAAFLGVGGRRRYAHRTIGLAVTLGRGRGTAQVRRFTFTGPLAWWMGRSYHLLMLPGMVRRLRVVSDWTLGLFFRRDVAQLGALGQPTPLPGREGGQTSVD